MASVATWPASGFDYLYDKVGMYDVMRDVICHRRGTDALTWAWQMNDDIASHMLYFLENHDEQRIASDFFAANAQKAVPALIANVLMQQNPFMLYAGQEYGESGMDVEGFSGHDGRTTIFDYWSLDTLCRAAAKKLTNEEQALADIYRRVLNIAISEKAVGEGKSFDLTYVNAQHFRKYAFLRKAGNEVLFVVVNFDDRPVSYDVLIPAHAFDYFQMNEGSYTAVDLLTDEQHVLTFKRDGKVPVSVAKRSGIILKFNA